MVSGAPGRRYSVVSTWGHGSEGGAKGLKRCSPVVYWSNATHTSPAYLSNGRVVQLMVPDHARYFDTSDIDFFG